MRARYRNIYIFIMVLALVGLMSGYKYYSVLDEELKIDCQERININEHLKKRHNGVGTACKDGFLILLSSVLVLPSIVNLVNIFYKPFVLGFLFNFFKTYGFKLSLIYNFVYYFIPLFFLLFLIKVGFTISSNIVLWIVKRNISYKRKVILLLKKYGIVFGFYLFYQIIVWIFSLALNGYFATLIK